MKKKDVSDYFSKLGKEGGKRRWEGKSKEEITRYMTEMINKRWKNLSTSSIQGLLDG